MAKAFTVAGVKSLPEGRHADAACRGLQLEVKGGSRIFFHRFKINLIPTALNIDTRPIACAD